MDRETGKSFVREMSNWNLLKHENIVELYDANIVPVPYIEMELCDESLDELHKPIEVKKAASIIFEIAKGLKHAHSKGIIHRDLKPSNILFKRGKAKISDWGLSKLRVSGSKGSSSTAAFSPLYASPEHFSRKKFGKTDERTDIYQLGVIFYEIVTGKLPFEGEDVGEISYSIINEEPERPSEINPKAKEVEHIIMKCISKRKEERYQSVDELLKDLAVYLKEEYKKTREFSKSAFFLRELVLRSVERGDTVDAVTWATEGLTSYPKRKYSENEVQMLKKSFEILMDIRKCCNQNTIIREVNRKYEVLKEHLIENEFIDEIERDKNIGEAIRRINVKPEDVHLDENDVKSLEYLCVKFAEKWMDRFLK